MAEEAALQLAEFVGLNAGFSFASDVTAQLFEGRSLTGPRASRRSRVRRRRAARAAAAATAAASDASGSDDAGDSGTAETGEPEARQGVDWRRAAAFAGTGVIFCGVTQFLRLRVIDAMFDPNDQTLVTAAAKTGLNQVVFSPVVRAASMATITYHAYRDWGAVREHLKADFLQAQTVSYMVKPLSNLIAFAVFPNHILAQAIVMRGASFGYNVYYSCVTHKRMHGDPGAAADRPGGAADGGAGDAPAPRAYLEVDLWADAPPKQQVEREGGGAAVSPRTSEETAGLTDSSSGGRGAAAASAAAADSAQPPQQGVDKELVDLKAVVQRRRRRWAEWEGKQRRAARARQERERAAEQRRDQRGCQWLRGVSRVLWGS